MKISLCTVLIFSACCFATEQDEKFQAVETERIPGILRNISKQTNENFEQIKTRQGELFYSTYFVHKGTLTKRVFERETDANGPCPDKVAQITESRIISNCDLDKELLYVKRSRETPSRYIDPATNKDLGTKSLPSSSSEIITNEYRYVAQPSGYLNDKVAQRKAVKTKIDQPSYAGGRQPDYLPRYIFDIDSQVWWRYPDYANIIEEKGEYVFMGLAMKAEQRTLSGDLQYRVYEPFYMNAFNIKGWLINTFSEKAGYNIIDSKRITEDGKLMARESTEYQKINGVYVPIKSTEKQFDYTGDFSLQSQQEETFKNVRINEPIPEGTFTAENLGLQEGDEFIDKVEDKEFKYRNDKLVEISEKPKD
ncbi:MAG: hypothetical protein WC900_08120 [Oscillospiraceae bacterium]